MLGSATVRAAGGSAIAGLVRSPIGSAAPDAAAPFDRAGATPVLVRSPIERLGTVSSTSAAASRDELGWSNGEVPLANRPVFDCDWVCADRTTGSSRLQIDASTIGSA